MELALGHKRIAWLHFKKSIAKGTEEAEPYFQAAKLSLIFKEREEAYSLATHGLRIALQNVRKLQKGLADKLQGNQHLFELKQSGDTSKRLQENDSLAVEAFHFITQKFSKSKVFPLVESLRDEYPDSGRLLFLISTYYSGAGEEKEGFSLLKQAVLFSPNLAEAHVALGEYYAQNHQTIKAIQSYERALSTDPQNETAYKALIQLYRRRGQLDQLCDRWLARYRVTQSNTVLKAHLIEALQKADRFSEAQKIIRQQ